jgi:phenylpropionate dioxygenase-like ring-hydroxylating dioxygenase large terminal subunit
MASADTAVATRTVRPLATPGIRGQEGVAFPPSFYTSQDVYEIEKQYIFRKEWLYACRVSSIPNAGDYVAMTLADEPVIVVRDNDGDVSAFSAVCRHRAMVIAEDGPGHCDRVFTCPYHGWTYDLAGELRSAPRMGGKSFERSDVAMPRFSAEVWHGFVFVNLDPHAPALADSLSHVEGYVENYRLEELVTREGWRTDTLEVNWKTLTENNSECYHCEHLHSQSHQCAPTRNVVPNTSFVDGSSPVVVTRVRTIHQDAFFSPDWKPHFPILSSLSNEDRNHFTWIEILPGFMLSLYHDQAGYWSTVPTGPTSVEIRQGRLYAQETTLREDFADVVELIRRQTAQLWEEDRFATASVQKGRSSHFATQGPYAELDEGVLAFNRWLVRHYEDAGLLA